MIGPYAERTRIREIIAAVDRDIARLPKPVAAEGEAPPTDLAASWAALVAILAVGPEPQVRDCPFCGHVVMRDATRCRECWKKLTPLS